MTFPLIDFIISQLVLVFGDRMMLPLILIGVIAVMILAIKGGKVILLLILMPFITTLLAIGSLSLIGRGMDVSQNWIVVTVWLGLGIVMSTVFFKLIR